MNFNERQAAKKARLEAAASRAQSESQRVYTRAKTQASCIPFGQPILVGHHSEKRDRNFRNGIHNSFKKSFELAEKAEYLEARAASVGTGGISSDDPEVLTKIKEKLARLEANQERMKKINSFIRKNNAQGIEALGYSAEEAANFFKPDFAGRIGFAAYQLTNNNANIKRLKDRIKELEAISSRENVEIEGKGYTYKEDSEENRVMFFFDAKPSADIRSILKQHGFKFSPSRNAAWVRQLNANGIYAGKCVRKLLDATE